MPGPVLREGFPTKATIKLHTLLDVRGSIPSFIHISDDKTSFFLIRAKRGLRVKRRYSHPMDRINTKVLCDQTVTLEDFYSRQGCPIALRRVVVKDDDGKRITFLTNNTSLAPETVGELYRLRWQIELLFKWIQQSPINQLLNRVLKNDSQWFERRVSGGHEPFARSEKSLAGRSTRLTEMRSGSHLRFSTAC